MCEKDRRFILLMMMMRVMYDEMRVVLGKINVIRV